MDCLSLKILALLSGSHTGRRATSTVCIATHRGLTLTNVTSTGFDDGSTSIDITSAGINLTSTLVNAGLTHINLTTIDTDVTATDIDIAQTTSLPLEPASIEF